MRSIAALLVGVAGVLAANALLSTTVGLRLSRESGSLSLAGVVTAAFSVGLALGAWRAPDLIRNVGHIRAFVTFCGTSTVATLVFGFIDSPLLWLLLRVAIGFCVAGTYLVVESWIGERTPSSRRGATLAIYIVVCQLAAALGQVLVRVYPVTQFEPFAMGALLYALALIPVAVTRTAQPEPPARIRSDMGALGRAAPVAVLGCLVAGSTTGILLTLGPIASEAVGRSTGETSSYMAVLLLGGIVLQWPVGRLSDRVDRRWVIDAVALSTAALGMVMVLHPWPSGAWALAEAAALGACAFVLYPLCLAHAQDLTPPADSVHTSAAMVRGYGVGAAIAPILGAYALELLGPRAFGLALAACNAPLVLFAVARVMLRKRLPPHEAVTFAPVALPQTSPGPELDPFDEPRKGQS